MAFKSNDRTFEKVYGIFDKRDYFNAKGLAKVQIGNFERALKKNDKGAQQILDKFKGDMSKTKDYITQVITDRKKEQAFNDYKAFKVAVDSIQKGKPQYGAVDLVKSRIHNSSQKYTIALYSALRNKKFTKWKDVHNDVDSLIGEGFKSDAQRKAAFANGYEEKGKKKKESVNEAIKYNKDGFVTKLENEAGKVVKDIQIDGEKFVLKGNKYVSKKGGKDLHKSHFGIKESVNENRFLDALKDFFRKEEPTFGQMAKRYKKKDDFIKWFVKSQAKQGVVFKKDGYGAYMMNRMGRIWDRVHGQPEDKKYVGESVNEIDTKKANLLRTNMPGYVGPKFAKKASDEDILAMADLKDQKARIYNRYVKVVDDAIAKLQKKYRIKESVNEAYVVLYSPKKGVKPVTTAAYKDKKDAEKWAKDLGGITMIVKKKVKGIDESEDGVPQGYNPMVESKTKESKIIQKIYQYSKNEKKFYDELAKHEVRIGQKDYAKFIINALRGFGINPREFKRIPDAEEKLYQTVSK